MRYLYLALAIAVVNGCTSFKEKKDATTADQFLDISKIYKDLPPKMRYSKAVGDSFRIYSATPGSYDNDSSASYPLIIVLDANAYFEPVVSELKLGTLTQGLPESIVVGIGYKDFLSMDSLRDRDYTFPLALPKDSFAISGGAPKFKEFIDAELLPEITKKFRIDQQRIALVGHSLGGYFVMFYLIESLDSKHFGITNFVAASPSLHYYDGQLIDRFRLSRPPNDVPIRLYSSIGSIEREPHTGDDNFDALGDHFDSLKYSNLDYKLVEYTNFDHMDAAMPGLMKGIGFVLFIDE